MTTHRRPEPCHYDRGLDQRVTRRHLRSCTSNDCDGCDPCLVDHCLICGTNHTTPSEPDTCGKCIGIVRNDLADILDADRDLRREATDAGGDGRLAAAAPIPGATAQVLIGPSVRLDILRVTAHTRADHAIDKKGRTQDPIPPLAVLAQWEDIYRTWLGHTHDTTPARLARWGEPVAGPRRATLRGAVTYLDLQLDYIANHVTTPTPGNPPDWVQFTKQVQRLRARMERELHDEREPEIGVACFNCGEKLVRRFRSPARCRHQTSARVEFRQALVRRAAAQDWLRVLGTYPELQVRTDELLATQVSAHLVAAARQPCEECAAGGQGGIDDPRPARSWECPGCRKQYDPGEYARAVRLSTTMDGDGWTHVTMAADAASTLTGHVVPVATVRKWMDRGKVASMCSWKPGASWGTRLVFYPDVADRALEVVERHARKRPKVLA